MKALEGMEQRELSAAVLKTAMAIEEFGIRFYSELSECVKDKRGSALLRGLGNDEGEHLRILTEQMSHASKGLDPTKVEVMDEYLKILPDKVFVKPKGSCMTLSDEIAALQKGIEVEENSIRMYQDALKMSLDDGTRATLEELVKWERRHKEILEENLHMLKLEGAWYGYGPILEG